MTRPLSLIALGVISLAACGRAQETATETTPPPAPVAAAAPATAATPTLAEAIPPEVRAVVLKSRPTMTITGATLKEREGRRYYDVEGTLPGGDEIELDLLEGADGWEVVEVQRDIPWAQAPASVKAAAEGARKGFVPVRVIESAQEGGQIIYELFADGQPATPALEVMVEDGKTEVLKEVWPH